MFPFADNCCRKMAYHTEGLEVERTDFTYMGYIMRTDRWRYTEWVGWNGTNLSPIWNALRASELYDHIDDLGTGCLVSTDIYLHSRNAIEFHAFAPDAWSAAMRVI